MTARATGPPGKRTGPGLATRTGPNVVRRPSGIDAATVTETSWPPVPVELAGLCCGVRPIRDEDADICSLCERVQSAWCPHHGCDAHRPDLPTWGAEWVDHGLVAYEHEPQCVVAARRARWFAEVVS